MRPAPTALVALIAAVLGGVSVLALGRSAGWIGTAKTTTVVERAPIGADAAPAAVLPPVKAAGAFDPARIYAARVPGVVTIVAFFGASGSADANAAQGSGFVASADGTILTNSHVVTTAGQGATGEAVKGAKELYVEFSDGERVGAKIVGWDLFDDVGVIAVDPSQHPLTPLPLGDSSAVGVGEPVAAIGSPFGNESSLSVGIVSATRRSIPSLTSKYDLVDAIQTDAPINHGNSGGPLFDARGRVIGINAQIRSGGGQSGFEGVGFAVPINSAKRSMRQLLASGRVAYAYIGIRTEDVTPSIARHFNFPTLHGALIDRVDAGTPGARAGLRGGSDVQQFNGQEIVVGGDLVVAINGEPVRNGGDVVRIVSGDLLPGQVARLTIVRGSRREVVPVRLVERPQ